MELPEHLPTPALSRPENTELLDTIPEPRDSVFTDEVDTTTKV